MNVKLDMPSGEWRDITADELSEIHRMVADSEKTIK
jgi:23S rRNA pseudouridine2604 synthase